MVRVGDRVFDGSLRRRVAERAEASALGESSSTVGVAISDLAGLTPSPTYEGTVNSAFASSVA